MSFLSQTIIVLKQNGREIGRINAADRSKHDYINRLTEYGRKNVEIEFVKDEEFAEFAEIFENGNF